MSFLTDPVAERVIVFHFEPKRREIGWTLYSGNVYYKAVDHIPIAVRQSTGDLDEGGSVSLSTGQWYFDPETRRLYVNSNDNSDPGTRTTVVTQRWLLSSRPIDFPEDADSGTERPHNPVITAITPMGQALDEANPTVPLESTGMITCVLTDALRELPTWYTERSPARVYLTDNTGSTVKKLFTGVLTAVSRSEGRLSFEVSDLLDALRKRVALDLLTNDDGVEGQLLTDSLYQRKRRLAGLVKGLRLIPAEPYTDRGLDITAKYGVTISTTASSTEGTIDHSTSVDSDVLADLLPGTQLLTAGGQVLEVADRAYIDVAHEGDVTATVTVPGDTTWSIAPGTGASFADLSASETYDVLVRYTSGGTLQVGVVYDATLTGGNLVGTFQGTKTYVGGTTETLSTGNMVVFVQDASAASRRVVFTEAATATETEVDCRIIPRNGRGVTGNNSWFVAGHKLDRLTYSSAHITALGGGRYELTAGTFFGLFVGDYVNTAGVVSDIDRENNIVTITGEDVTGDNIVREGCRSLYWVRPDGQVEVVGERVYSTWNARGAYIDQTGTSDNDLQLSGRYVLFRRYIIRRDNQSVGFVLGDVLGYSVAVSANTRILSAPVSWAGCTTIELDPTDFYGEVGTLPLNNKLYFSDEDVLFADVYGYSYYRSLPLSIKNILENDADFVADELDTSFSSVGEYTDYVHSAAFPALPDGDAPTVREACGLLLRTLGAALSIQDGVITPVMMDPGRAAVTLVPKEDILRVSITEAQNTYTNITAGFANQDVGRSGRQGVTELVEVEEPEADVYGKAVQQGRDYFAFADVASATTRAYQWLATSTKGLNILSVVLPLSYFDTQLADVVAVDVSEFIDNIQSNHPTTFVGRVVSVLRSDTYVQLRISDLGGAMQAGSISDDTTPVFTSSTQSELVSASYITDDDGTVNGQQSTVGCNRIW